MIRVLIGSEDRNIASANEQWVLDRIDHELRENGGACVTVYIEEGDINMRMSTKTCSSAVTDIKTLSLHERALFDLWRYRGLNDDDFKGEKLVEFLRQIDRIFNTLTTSPLLHNTN